MVRSAVFVSRQKDVMKLVLHAYLMEEAISEAAYEPSNRPRWVGVPLREILTLLGQ